MIFILLLCAILLNYLYRGTQMLFFYPLLGTGLLILAINILLYIINWLFSFRNYKLTPKAYYILSASMILIGGTLLNIYIIHIIL